MWLVLFGQNKTNRLIRFDGLYETKCLYEEDEGEQGYLRFYLNGKVISVGTDCDGTAYELKDWFNMEMEYLSIGAYRISGRRVRFSSNSITGTVIYTGRITKKGNLKLRTKSLINGYKAREEYIFIEIPEWR